VAAQHGTPMQKDGGGGTMTPYVSGCMCKLILQQGHDLDFCMTGVFGPAWIPSCPPVGVTEFEHLIARLHFNVLEDGEVREEKAATIIITTTTDCRNPNHGLQRQCEA
jgi:hypothetical protein